MIKVLIVDDHALVRMGICRLLEDQPDIEVIADAENGEKALSLVKIHKPDVVLLDMKMPGIDGWEVTRRLKKSHPKVKVIAVTALSTDATPARVLHLGARGYITKECGADEMAQAIRRVADGEKYISSEIAQRMAINSLEATQETPFDKLSDRETQIMLMITNGLGVATIAERLFLSTKTVNGHRYAIFKKLNIHNDVELTHLAMKYRIIERPMDAT